MRNAAGSILVEAALRLPAHVAALGLRLRRCEPRAATLEDVFVDLVGAGA